MWLKLIFLQDLLMLDWIVSRSKSYLNHILGLQISKPLKNIGFIVRLHSYITISKVSKYAPLGQLLHLFDCDCFNHTFCFTSVLAVRQLLINKWINVYPVCTETIHEVDPVSTEKFVTIYDVFWNEVEKEIRVVWWWERRMSDPSWPSLTWVELPVVKLWS